MLLTPKLVFIHMPKTGGTFANKAIVSALRGPEPPAGMRGWLRRRRRPSLVHHSVHGTCSEIPPSHRGLPVVSIVRNPYERYVSQYEFGWWRDHPEDFPWIDWKVVKEQFQDFPDLDFGDFVRFASLHLKQLQSGLPRKRELVGFHTEQLIRFYARSPGIAYPVVARSGHLLGDELHDVHFLRMDSLNSDLTETLLRLGVAPHAVEFIRSAGKVFPKADVQKVEDRKWDKYYDSELHAYVRRMERVVFELFPEYDVPLQGDNAADCRAPPRR